MAGFFGMFDYSKPGKGVDKNGPQKKRFFLFFELYFRKFSKMILLNLMFLAFCIPIITIGPATVAMMKVLKDMSIEKPVFLWSDFIEAFKKNFVQGLIVGCVNAVIGVLLYVASAFYLNQIRVGAGVVFYIPLAITAFVLLMVIMTNFYLYLMIPTVNLNLGAMIKNSFSLAILGIKTNIFTVIFILLFGFVFIYTPIIVLIILIPTVLFTFFGFIIAFNSYQYIEKYIIEPYYEKTGEKRPDVYYPDEDDFEDIVFEDIGTKEVAQKKSKQNKSKTIK